VKNWELFLFLAGLLTGWSIIMLTVMKFMLARHMKDIDEKLKGFMRLPEDYQRMERQVLELKAELPLCYVRREDFIREELTINAKLDHLRDLIEEKVRVTV
jgi:hypothetical protein